MGNELPVAVAPATRCYVPAFGMQLGRANPTIAAPAPTSRHGVRMLVYYEPFGDIEEAIQRERTMKHWVRAWKTNLIELENPLWIDLYPALLALPGNSLDEARGGMGPRDKREDDT